MIEDKLKRMAAQRPADEAYRQKNKEKVSEERLFRIIQKKLQTSFIGAISEFEKKFGKLWGHGLGLAECTENQQKWRKLWDETRNKILNNGNNQIRALESELKLHNICWTGYHMNLRGGRNVND